MVVEYLYGQSYICIGMSEALTEWDLANGFDMAYEKHGITWIDIVEDFVLAVLCNAADVGVIPDFGMILKGLKVLRLPWDS